MTQRQLSSRVGAVHQLCTERGALCSIAAKPEGCAAQYGLLSHGPLKCVLHGCERCLQGSVSAARASAQGAFHRAQLASAGVCLLADPLPDSTTGTVTVLTTGDADRTFLSYLGDGQALTLTPALEAALGACRMLVVEGYLWEMPGAAASVAAAIAAARSGGAGIALTAGDPGLVARHREDLWGALREGVDVFFANRCAPGPNSLVCEACFVPS